MIMDTLDSLTHVTMSAELGLPSVCYDTPSTLSEVDLGLNVRHVSEALDEGLNTPVTKYSDSTFFGPDALDPPPITATGMYIAAYSFNLIFFAITSSSI